MADHNGSFAQAVRLCGAHPYEPTNSDASRAAFVAWQSAIQTALEASGLVDLPQQAKAVRSAVRGAAGTALSTCPLTPAGVFAVVRAHVYPGWTDLTFRFRHNAVKLATISHDAALAFQSAFRDTNHLLPVALTTRELYISLMVAIPEVLAYRLETLLATALADAAINAGAFLDAAFVLLLTEVRTMESVRVGAAAGAVRVPSAAAAYPAAFRSPSHEVGPGWQCRNCHGYGHHHDACPSPQAAREPSTAPPVRRDGGSGGRRRGGRQQHAAVAAAAAPTPTAPAAAPAAK